ncbi:uncharacterized protein MONOS_9754 [Monocercomonoides exilis]|uniref:uncharacterized protein n=1 Tax=Monocercomonoides exilis TaxID=2049356 RepID=UPI00355A34D6|nr:hypothetical protein MONOS_9754 [Monocercomonoides exilis]|eukprot:MONOS_9754.1-p1 / transcript=MONOS_9754.1 / gene=MONOS_9754 / organism=Monocercomonoides_exilis_PA203 / gene_product=unspecified product / transcript_product=unspecified product / location=Mono_scaffold00415:26954-27595(-) / protein_length=130 / sequence_SO=supercontig / SO=protein_coding / is_pseudo=false
MRGFDGSDATNAIPLVYFWRTFGPDIFIGSEGCDFVIPSSFASGVNVLMQVGSSEGLLTEKDCSFTKKRDDSEEVTHYGLIKAEGGTVVLDFVTMQSLCFSKDFVSVLSPTILNIKNLTMKNVELEGES